MSRNVLVVDDNAVDRSRLEKLMTGAGYLVTLAILKRNTPKPNAVMKICCVP